MRERRKICRIDRVSGRGGMSRRHDSVSKVLLQHKNDLMNLHAKQGQQTVFQPFSSRH